MALRTTEDSDTKLNPGQVNADQRFNSQFKDIAAAEEAGTFSDIASNYDKTADSSQEESNVAKAREAEENPKADFINNVTGKNNSAKVKGKLNFLKKKGPLALIGGVFGGGGIVALLTFSPLPFLGQNINALINEKMNTGIGMASTSNDNLLRVKLFSNSPISASCNNRATSVVCKYRGITQTEMTSLKRNGVKFIPENGNSVSRGKFTFDAIEVDGTRIDANNFKVLAKEPSVSKAIKPIRNPMWNSIKNSARDSVIKAYGITQDPNTRATNREDLNKKIYSEVTEGSDSSISSAARGEDDPNPDNAPEEIDNSAVAGDLQDEVEALREAANNGDDIPRIETDLAGAINRNGSTVSSVSSLGSKAWGWVNSLDLADTICTLYQFANTASSIGRTVALVNVIRYGHIFISTWDKMKAGDAEPEDYEQLMSVITSVNDYGQAFDASAAAQYLFTGKLTSEPSTVSSLGGEALQTMTMGMYALHKTVGLGNSAQGRVMLRSGCGLATNLAVQVGVTAVTLVASVFTGGGVSAAVKGGSTAIKLAYEATKTTIRDFVKEKIGSMVSRSVSREVRQAARHEARTFLRKQMTDPLNMAAASLFLVETFGLDYITQALAGTDVLSYMDDSVQSMDSIGTAASAADFASVIAMGGSVQTIDEKAAYDQQNSQLINEAIALEKQTANPLDANNPYSKLGSFLGNLSTHLGGFGISSGLLSSVKSVIGLPITSLASSLKPLSVSAVGIDPTPQNLSDYVNDTFMKENNLCVDVMGTACAGADLNYLASIDIDELFLSAIDSGYINEDGSIVSGSTYATHVSECNNPQRTQVDYTLFDASQVIPSSCRDGSSLRKYFNALTTYRSQIFDGDESQTTGYTPTLSVGVVA